MRIFAVSDLHVDYQKNRDWIASVSSVDYRNDMLILAGDVCDDMNLLQQTLSVLADKFDKLMFVPGNHELWIRDSMETCSLRKFERIREMCRNLGVVTDLFEHDAFTFVPLFSWYDHSFATPDRHLLRAWRDYSSCRWPPGMESSEEINRYFLALNRPHLHCMNKPLISFSHFLPRIDLMPERIPSHKRTVYPVLGSVGLGEQVKQLQPDIHVYGHSHVNRHVVIDGIQFVNNAFGYPGENRIARKALYCIHDSDAGISSHAVQAGELR